MSLFYPFLNKTQASFSSKAANEVLFNLAQTATSSKEVGTMP